MTAEQVVELKIREAIDKPEGDLTPEDLLQVTELELCRLSNEHGCALVNLRGLAGCASLEELDLMWNELTDISEVWEFKNLKKLVLHGNHLEDGQLQYLDGLTELTELSLGDNQFTRIPDLKQYPKLWELSLCG
ncbi:MAG: leucine-rich repeat domain-containing protein, partial [bacterium]